jgi:hypothetical protein
VYKRLETWRERVSMLAAIIMVYMFKERSKKHAAAQKYSKVGFPYAWFVATRLECLIVFSSCAVLKGERDRSLTLLRSEVSKDI